MKHEMTRRANRKGNAGVRACCCTALAVAIAACLPIYTAAAQTTAAEASVRFDISAGDLAGALERFSTQSGIQLLYRNDLVAGKRARSVSGSMAPDAGLRRLLEGSGLVTERLNETTFVLKAAPAPAAAQSGAPSVTSSQWNPEPEEVKELEGLTVTGTRIRGAQPSSPLLMITQEEMRLSGHNNLGDVIRALPQNFAGGQNPGVAVGATPGGIDNQNVTGSSTLNLRGLGPSATLTLLNGSRLPYDGFGHATDVSSIPTAAIDRMDILLDGASAIYGSDAIGGVVNIVLRRDYHGAEVSARYGVATDGGYEQQQYTGLFGRNWGSGGFLITGDISGNSPVRARQRDYLAYHPYQELMIYPKNDQKSTLFSGHQNLGGLARIGLDAFYTERSDALVVLNSATVASENKRDTTIKGFSSSLEFDLPGLWELRLHGSMGHNESAAHSRSFNISTGAQTSLFGTTYDNEAHAAGIGAEGPLFALPGGEVRLSLGGGWRRNTAEQRSTITGAVAREGENRSTYGYAEVHLPLVGEAQGVSFVHELTLNAALRYESYDVFGDTKTPRIGMLWGVTTNLDFRASWGRSFQAPTVGQRTAPQQLYLYPATPLGGAVAGAPTNAQVIYEFGGNPFLEPEKAENFAVGFTARPEFLSGLHVDLNWFQIKHIDRIGTPVVAAQALSNPAFAPAVTLNPTAAQIGGAFAWAGYPEGTFTNNFANAPYNPAVVFAIVHGASSNIASDYLRGVDLSIRHGLDVWDGRLSLSANGAWILDAKRRITSASPETPVAGVIFRPAEFKGRLGASWSGRNLTLASNLNYVAGVTDNNAAPNAQRDSMKTFDFIADYQVTLAGIGDVGLNLAVINAFNQKPPIMQPLQNFHVNYDSTNYSALGRVVSLAVTKKF